MAESSYVVSVPVTPEYVLAVFRDQHRQVARVDYCCDAEIDLTFDSTIEDWRNAMDLLPARRLGRAMNEWWQIQLSDREWREVLHPPRHKTLRGVANLIALHATRRELRPLSIAGTHCLPAAAFLAIKDCLSADGADVSNLAPSTPLAEYAKVYPVTLIGKVSCFAPGALPDISVCSQEDCDTSIGKMATFLSVVGGVGFYWDGVFGLVGVLGMVLFLCQMIICRRHAEAGPKSVSFGELRTFRDMAKCVAAGVANQSTAIELNRGSNSRL